MLHSNSFGDVAYRRLPDGAFVAGDRRTGITSYAYPTSEHATRARREPLSVAVEMLSGEMPSVRVLPTVKQYDGNNWEKLGGVQS